MQNRGVSLRDNDRLRELLYWCEGMLIRTRLSAESSSKKKSVPGVSSRFGCRVSGVSLDSGRLTMERLYLLQEPF